MMFMQLSSFDEDESKREELDRERLILELKRTIPEIEIDREDLLLSSARRSEEFFQGKETGIEQNVVRSMFRKADEFGPANRIRIKIEGSEPITGLIRRYDVRVSYENEAPQQIINALRSCLTSVGVGKFEEGDLNIPR